jgi:S-adenosylmethionine/arginine decarboxylase-like enzyme
LAQVNKHILVTGYIAEAPGPEYVYTLQDWFNRLVEAVDMKVLIDPICVWCNDEGNEGVTGMVGITTSHSSIHFWSGEPSYYKFDLYSCKDFALESVAEMLKELGTYKFTYTVVDRTDDEHPVIDSGVIHF